MPRHTALSSDLRNLFGQSSSPAWQPSHGFRHRGLAAGTLAAALCLPALARAEDGGPDGDPAAAQGERPRVGVGVTAGIGTLGVGTLSAGVDVWYRPKAAFAVGLEAQAFHVDNGADPQYCSSCIENGRTLTAVAEARLPTDLPVSAFARLGAGAALVQINGEDVDQPDSDEVVPMLAFAAGPELELAFVFLRLRGTATAVGGEAFVGVGAEIGAVF